MQEECKPFGCSLHLDLYDCENETLNSLEVSYRFLEKLVDILGMSKMSAPIVIHGPTDKGVELYPGKHGISGCIFLIESSITIHTICPRNFVSIDVYTCGKLDRNDVLSLCQSTFNFKRFEETLLLRGMDYSNVPENECEHET